MNDWVRYSTRDEFPRREYPRLTDHFLALSDEFEKKKRNKTIKKIVVIYPKIRRTRYGQSPLKKEGIPSEIEFPVFCSNRTIYATIKEVAPIFTKFYMKTSIFPIVSPYPMKIMEYFNDMMPEPVVESFRTRGALIYDIEG